MTDWYLPSAAGRRGPFSRDELRRMRAAFEIPAEAIVCDDAGMEIAICELLPEFQTGPLERPPNPPPRSITPPLLYRLGIYPWGAIRALFPPLPSFRFRYSLRTLLLCFLFLGPLLGIISNDLASQWRQARIVQPWLDAGGSVGWERHPWRFWKRDVSDLSAIRVVLSGAPCGNLDQLPELRSVHFFGAGCSREQFSEICRSPSIGILHLSDKFSDSDLADLVQLRNLRRLHLEHAEAHLTLRRLRRHPRLESVFLGGSDRSIQIANDAAAMPQLREFNFFCFGENPKSEFVKEYKSVLKKQPASVSLPPAEFYNVAFVGAPARRKLLDSLLPAAPRTSDETAYEVLVRPEAKYLVTTPRSDDWRIAGRVLWMADRAFVVVDAHGGLTDIVRQHCLLARVLRTPDRYLLLVNGNNVPAGRWAEVLDECERARKELGVDGVISDDEEAANWLSRGIALRPPTPRPATPGTSNNLVVVETSVPTPPPAPRGQWVPANERYSYLRHNLQTGQIVYDYDKERLGIHWMRAYETGEEVVLLRNGQVLGLGVLK